MRILVKTTDLSYDEWLIYRKRGICGSDASIVLGLNPYRSVFELWEDKTGTAENEESSKARHNEAAHFGNVMEPIIIREFQERTGLKVRRKNAMLQSDEYPWMLANLDGECIHPDYGICGFEAKTASAYKADEWENAIPDEYQLQLQHYMAVTGYQGFYIAVLIGGNTFRWKFIKRDEELISMLIELESAFWSHVVAVTPPPLDGSEASAKFLTERFPTSVPKSQITLPDTAAALLAQYDEACEKLETITEQKQRAENRLKELLGEHESGTAAGRIVTWKTVSQERLDSKTLKAEHPTLYGKYSNKISYRRFSIRAAV